MRSRASVLVRWVVRATGPDLLRYLLPQWTALFLVFTQLEVIVDFREVARIASSLPPSSAGAALGLLCALSSLSSRGLVADIWLGPRHAVLRRQPLPGAAWWPAALAVLGPIVAPVGVSALFWYGARAWPAALTWFGLALVPTVLAAGGRWVGWGIACAIAGGVAAIGQAWPAAYLGGWIPVWAAALPLAGILTADLASWSSGPIGRIPLRPRTAIGALLHRDGLAIWRRERRIVLTALAAAAPVGLVAGAMSVNGEYPGPTLATGALIGLALIGPIALQAATGVARNLGRRFDPPEWPISASQRILSLASIASGTLVPGWAAAAAAAPGIGVGGHLRIGSFVAAIGAGAAWWVVSRPGRPNPGTWPYWIAICLAPTLVPGGAWLAVGIAATAFGLAARRLERGRCR